ncbi:MAG TPA: lysophospholipid acyltransferase family protein [Sphingobacteriaceae bacterium]
MLNTLSRFFALLHFLWAALVFLAGMFAVLPFIVFCTLVFRGKRSQDAAFVFIRLWARMFSSLAFFICRVEGHAAYRADRPYVFVSNHTSFLDAVMLVLVLPQSFKPLGKIEMARVPVFGMIYRKVAVLIDRTSRESRERCVEELKAEVSGGQSILIFPEGTMNRTAAPLTEFYDGAFRIAIETQTPLAPVVLINAGKLLPRKDPFTGIRPGVVRAVMGTPVDVTGLTLRDLPVLKNQVYRQMEAMLIGGAD